MQLDDQSIVASVARQYPSTVKIFQRYRIDFCCSGNIPLADACERAGQDLQEVLTDLRELARTEDSTGWDDKPLVELIDHIITRYHDRLRQDLPALGELARRVATRHGEANPKLREVETVFARLADEMLTHLRKEEVVLFPMIERLENRAVLNSDDGTPIPPIDGPVAAMEDDHREVGDFLARLFQLTDQFTPPSSACNSYRGLFQGLSELEKDTHQHIHLENNILFPRAQQLVAQPDPRPLALS